MNKKHKYAIKRLGEIAMGLRNSIGSFPKYYLVSLWKKNLEGIEEAIEVLKANE